MGYALRTDDNGLPIQEGFDRIYVVEIDGTAVASHEVPITSRIFQLAVKRLPVDATMEINGFPDRIPLDEGEVFGVFDNLRQLIINVEEAKENSKIILMLFE